MNLTHSVARHGRLLQVLSALFLCCATARLGFAAGASASASSTVAAAGEAPIELSPFEVRAEDDTGYRATNTLDGSRLNTALKDTPGAISVFTRDLLDDLGMTDVMELLKYDVSAEEWNGEDEYGLAGEFGKSTDIGLSTAWRTRGLKSSASTNGFAVDGKTDMYNVESVGSTRGPNSILFGNGAAGGVLNFRTKQANPVRHSNQVEFKFGEYDLQRASFDFNRALIKNKLALRALALVERRNDPAPHVYANKDSFTLAGHHRFRQNTNLNFSFENTRTEAVKGRQWNPQDRITLFESLLRSGDVVWDPSQERYETRAGAAIAAAQGAGNLNNRTVLVQGPDLGPALLWEGARSNANHTTFATSTSQFSPTLPSLDESYARLGSVTTGGPSEFGVVNFRTFTATFNHRWFENFYMELAYNYSTRDSDGNVVRDRDIRADLNYRLPDGRLNPYFYGNGYYFIETRWVRQTQEYDNETLRASFSYETGSPHRWWGRHRFATMAERHINTQTSDRRQYIWAGAPFGGTPEATANQIKRRRYFRIDGPREDFTSGFNPAGPFITEEFTSPNLGGRTLTTAWVPPNDQNYQDEITTDSLLLVMQNYLLKNRLVLTAGWRRDSIDSVSPQTIRDAVTNEWRIANAKDQPAFAAQGENWTETTSEKGGRKTVGGVFHINDHFSVTANASDNVGVNRRNREVLPEEVVPDSSRGKGVDYGINFSFVENRISGSIKRYESRTIKEGGQGLVENAFVNPNNDVLRAFDFYFRAAGITALGSGAPVQSVDELTTTWFSHADGYLSDRESEGYEFEFIATPTRNWTMRASYANSDRSRTNVLREGDGWWAERLELFDQLDSVYRTRTGRASVFNQPLVNADGQVLNQTVAQRIAEAAEDLETTRFQQEQGFGNRKHKASFWTRYNFDQGRLKGFTVGGGWRYQSANISGINLVTREIYYGNATSLFDLMLAYRTKGFFGRWGERIGVTYQLNVSNLLDDRTIFIAKTAADAATNRPYPVAATRQAPRMTTFTARFAF